MLVRDYLHCFRHFPIASLQTVIGDGPVMIISPHPDDETLGCGGLIAGARDLGQMVTIVTVTDGSASHRASMTHPPRRLAALRRAETRDAADVLGVPPDELVHLDLSDAQTPMEGPAFDETVARIEAVVRTRAAETILVTSALDPHCDHVSAAAMAERIARRHGLRLWFYPIWSWHLPPDDLVATDTVRGVRLDITPWHETKQRAIACHASQMTDLIDDDPDGFRFDARSLAPFVQPFEVFIEAVA